MNLVSLFKLKRLKDLDFMVYSLRFVVHSLDGLRIT